MEKRIALECRGRDPAQVTDLNLDNCRSTSIMGLTDEYVNLESLSLINVGLLSLKGFPKLPNLKKLELSDNRICQELERLSGSPKLTHLNLSGNKIGDIATLGPLKQFQKLKNLDLYNNDVTSIEEYRSKVFDLIPSLKYLDGYDKDEREVEDSEEDEPNGNNDSSGEEEEEDSEEEDGDMPLTALYNDKLGAEGSGSDYDFDDGKNGSDFDEEDEEEWGEEEEEEKEVENKVNQSENTRGKKRKHEESESNN